MDTTSKNYQERKVVRVYMTVHPRTELLDLADYLKQVTADNAWISLVSLKEVYAD